MRRGTPGLSAVAGGAPQRADVVAVGVVGPIEDSDAGGATPPQSQNAISSVAVGNELSHGLGEFVVHREGCRCGLRKS